SKLRLAVESTRSPGLPRSPLLAAHMEQPDSPHENPADLKTWSRPAASACLFTVVDPGTTMTTTCGATRRPLTMAAAGSRSGSRVFVQEPMNTRSTDRLANEVPGASPI